MGGVPGDRNVSFIVAAKEMTESCTSMGDALAFDRIKPSGTLGYRFVKRLFDLVFSLLMSVLLLIPIAVVCALISLESPGSPMYAQERVGKGGKTIRIFKLRSMVADAGNVQKYLSPEQLHQWEVERKVDDDPRITKVGLFIRKCSIDEMPQFLNVLNGDLSVNMRKPLSIGMFVRARFETGLFRFPSGEPAHAAWLSRRLPGKLISAGSCGCASGGQPGMSAHPTAFRFSVRRYRTNPVFCRARPGGCPSKRS